MNSLRWVSEIWEALERGDLGPLEAALDPNASWRAVEDGPWNYENREAIVSVMRENLANGLSGRIEDAFEVGERVVVGFRPDHHSPQAWPLDNGVRYVVLTLAGERVSEMEGCRDRGAALAYAGGG